MRGEIIAIIMSYRFHPLCMGKKRIIFQYAWSSKSLPKLKER